MSKNSDIQLSKSLSWLLRHGAVKEGLQITPEGYISVNEILRHKSLRKWNIKDVERVVAENNKQRFTLKKNSDGQLEIKANQGHSIENLKKLDLRPIMNPNEINKVIHGTYYKFWESIKGKGLSRMRRNHIHFAKGLPKDDSVISGMRSNCEVFIYVDLESALKDGIEFFESENCVILCPGNREGILEPKYFSKVIDARTGHNLEY